MPFVFESVNSVELMQQQFVSCARQTNIHSNFGELTGSLTASWGLQICLEFSTNHLKFSVDDRQILATLGGLIYA